MWGRLQGSWLDQVSTEIRNLGMLHDMQLWSCKIGHVGQSMSLGMWPVLAVAVHVPMAVAVSRNRAHDMM